MYLSPRRALSSFASAMLAGFRRPGDDAGLVVPLAVGVAAGRSCAATVSRWARTGSGMTPGTGEPVGSIVGCVCMSATFPSAGHLLRRPTARYGDGCSVAGDDAVREVAVRRLAGGALREVASQKR